MGTIVNSNTPNSNTSNTGPPISNNSFGISNQLVHTTQTGTVTGNHPRSLNRSTNNLSQQNFVVGNVNTNSNINTVFTRNTSYSIDPDELSIPRTLSDTSELLDFDCN